MRELSQIDTSADHECDEPTIERWNVLEPISGGWMWMTVFGCCSQVVIENAPHVVEEDEIQRAA